MLGSFTGRSLLNETPFQDQYPVDSSHCYGCGRLNEHGLHIKSFWDGDETICYFEPAPFHTAFPGYVYGGLIASLIDCHSTGTAAAAASRSKQLAAGEPFIRFVTASLHVDYLRPTPMGVTLELRARIKQAKGRKIIVSSTLYAGGLECARGEVVAVQMPEALLDDPPAPKPER